jgi:glycosyltransferase involved in cell wall biosynthesis
LSSKATEADFLNFFPDASSKTKVLPFKIFPISSWYKEDPKRIQKKYHLPDKFFLISNQFWQHKNHLAAFEALKLIYEKSIYPDIVCTGHLYDQRQPDYADTILQAIHELGIAKQVHLLGLIPKSEQIQLVRRAIAIIQPSFFEGWSTVVEEAKCFGKSIILSDLPVNREQNPPNSLFFKPESSEQLADLIATSWERLNPGPDFEQEMNAKKNYLNKVNDFAYDFIEIARGA